MNVKLIDYKALGRGQQGELLVHLLQPLYLNSFPKEERRSWADWLALFEEEASFSLQIIQEDDRGTEAFIGFLALWHLSEEYLFVEHFALLEQVRNKGLGAEALGLLQKLNSSRALLLECEPPRDELAKRRLDFYARQGFTILSKSYEQPSYYPFAEGKLKQRVKLYLLANRQMSNSQVTEVIKLIYRRVYSLS